MAVAGFSALVAVPAAVAALLVLLLGSATLDGFDIESDLRPAEAGVSTSPDGQVVVHPSACGPGLAGSAVSSIRLLGPDGSVAWQADALTQSADHPSVPDTVVVGQAPAGFVEVVPLAGPLDPGSPYEVQMSVLGPGATTGAPPPPDADLFAVFGQSATFRPVDLAPDTVWHQDRAVTPEVFSQAPCDADDADEPAGT